MYFFSHSILPNQISLEFKINRMCVCVRIYIYRERERTHGLQSTSTEESL